MYKPRVVITDMETYSTNGFLPEMYNRYCTNRLIKPMEIMIPEIRKKYPVSFIFNENHPITLLERPIRKTMSKATELAYQTALKICQRQNLDKLNSNKTAIGIVAGNTVSQFPDSDIFKNSRTSDIFKALNNNTATNIAKCLNLNGSIIPNSTSCATSLHSLIIGYDEIISGNNDMMLVGGSDEWTPFMQFVFDKLNIASEDSCRPFFLNRDGTVIGEGASMFLIEEFNHALDRNATIYGEILGTAITQSDSVAYSTTNSIIDVMNNALRNAEETIEDELHINILDTHGTGTEIGDASEADVINNCGYNKATVVAWKYFIQHLLAAGGLAELAMTLACIQRNVKLPDIRDIAGKNNQQCIIRERKSFMNPKHFYTVMKNSFGLGGINVSVVIKV